MIVLKEDTFRDTFDILKVKMSHAPGVVTEFWQGTEANLVTRELRNVVFEIDLEGIEDLVCWREDIGPNLPWADDHFKERVGGEPLNPGEEWKNWPWALGASRFKTGRFNHTYAERLWPKFARRTEDGRLPLSMSVPQPLSKEFLRKTVRRYPDGDRRPHYGIGSHYGDLQDLVDLLVAQPHTRQAWIPLFFPEDTGLGDGGRKPCTLGYQLLLRDGLLHIWYPLRSCDLVRHFRDDCYLAVRLLLWVLEQCRLRDASTWDAVAVGTYAMHVTSLHVFESDVEGLWK